MLFTHKKNKKKEKKRPGEKKVMFLFWLKGLIYFVISQEFQEFLFFGNEEQKIMSSS